MVTIVVFSQNLVLSSLVDYLKNASLNNSCVFVTPHKLFDFEKNEIISVAEKPIFYSFSELLTDKEEEEIDFISYGNNLKDITKYYETIKQNKNHLLIKKLLSKYPIFDGIIFSDDLGICLQEWISAGFNRVYGDYYHIDENDTHHTKFGIFNSVKSILNNKIYKSITNDDKKVLFYGDLSRVGYRIDLEFKRAKIENIKYVFQKIIFKVFKCCPCSKKVTRLTSIHESIKWNFPNCTNFKVGIVQDGFLPDNYTSKYLKFAGDNVLYLAWDKLGCLTFEFHKINHGLLPYRKKIYLPYPKFSNSIKKILFSASGAGDWTALKNRSDDDNLVIIAGEIAKRFPDIKIVFRCHPTWTHPKHQGVNSIKRVIQYINSLEVDNFVLSGNIPENSLKDYKFSFSRNSFEKDLENVDLVIGEHSISMIDGLLKSIPFISVNVTGRRDFFSSITRLGFPHAESLEELIKHINEYGTDSYIKSFNNAIDKYNAMTDEE